jgi:dihydrofolate synthase/folylpolyglutamate synthase
MTDSRYLDALRTIYRPTLAADLPQTLEPIETLLTALDAPHLEYPAVVVAGSTGKGTAVHRLAGRLSASGLRVGMYTSPHVHSFRERFAIDGVMITQNQFIEVAEVINSVAQSLGKTYSTFEAATALALTWFAWRQVDIAVLEVGLGGRFDAVNAVPNCLAAFTPIEGEHRAMLGGSLASVAWHKAGIMRRDGLAVTVPQNPEVRYVLESEALDQNIALVTTASDSALPKVAWEHLIQHGVVAAPPSKPNQVNTTPPGRLELVQLDGQTVLIDGGHTPLSGLRARRSIDMLLDWGATVRVVVGMLDDKDAAGYLEAFDARDFHIVLTRIPGHRGASAESLAHAFTPKHASVGIIEHTQAALDSILHADETVCVVAGSLRLAALAREQFGLVSPDDLAEAEATRAIFTPANI